MIHVCNLITNKTSIIIIIIINSFLEVQWDPSTRKRVHSNCFGSQFKKYLNNDLTDVTFVCYEKWKFFWNMSLRECWENCLKFWARNMKIECSSELILVIASFSSWQSQKVEMSYFKMLKLTFASHMQSHKWRHPCFWNRSPDR